MFNDYPYTDFNKINLDWLLETVKKLAEQSQGEPGVGVPTGGTTGQVLTKASDTDYDTEWSDVETSDIEYFDVTLTLAPGGAYYNSNKTPAQIVAAITAGQTVRAILSTDDETEYTYHFSYRPATFDGEYYTEDHVSFLLIDGRTISCEGSRTVWPFDSVVGQYDSQLSLYSTNAVENRVITAALQNIQPSQEAIQDAVDNWLDDHAASIDGLSFEAKNALLTLLRHVAYTDANGIMYYTALESALVGGVTLDHITVVYNPGTSVIYVTDSLDSLRQYITVTAYYSDESYSIVDTYTLSGTLSNGSNAITVAYGGFSETITVIATQYELYDYIFNSRTSGTGTDYVLTDIVHNPSFCALNVEFEVMNGNNSNTADALFSSNTNSTADNGNMVWYARANKAGISAYNLGVAKQLNTIPGDTRAIVKYHFVDGGESYLEWNGTQVAVATISAAAIQTTNVPLVLAGGYSFSTGSLYGMFNNGVTKLGYVKFTDPDTENDVYYFRPAKDIINNTWGYLETISGTFYASNGSYYRCANWS